MSGLCPAAQPLLKLQPLALSAASNQERGRENRKSLKEDAGGVGTCVGVCMEAPTCTPRLTGCQQLPGFQETCVCVGRAAPGFLQHPCSKQPAPSAWLSPSLSLFLSHTRYFTVVFCPKRLASEWSSLPAHWTQPRNSKNMKDSSQWG